MPDSRFSSVTRITPVVWGVAAAAAAALIALAAGLPPKAVWTSAITALCVTWWLTEAVPLAATALVPLAVLPLAGVLTPAQVAEAYGDPLILLFLGGFLISKAVEASGAHRRIALALVHRIGNSGRRLVVGFTLASALLSMWMSNTATVMILLPVALAVVQNVGHARVAACLLLGVAYGASIGGIATPIGSPPNAVFLRIYEQYANVQLGFAGWMAAALPVVAVLLPVAILWLSRGLGGIPGVALPAVGAWRAEERRVLLVFGATAAAWLTRTAPFGGWSAWIGAPSANDASVALIAAVALSVIPNGRGGRLLEWETAKTIPWDVLLLFAGGITIANAFATSGLSEAMGALLAGIGALPPFLLVLGIVVIVIMLSEVASNTATAILVLPLLATAALASATDPRLLMMPAAFAASCGFMLPIATPPNAIVFGTGRVPMGTLVREGLILDVSSAAVIAVVCFALLR